MEEFIPIPKDSLLQQPVQEPVVHTVNVCDPGRAAYEAFCKYTVERSTDLEATPWDSLPRVMQLAWYAAGHGAIEHFQSLTKPLHEVPKE